tara:strand:+ start:4178 stop:4588 length:411 start_codon:yes stop_codon:yes gene_type:complete
MEYVADPDESFVTDKARDLTNSLNIARAELAAAGGVAEFDGLFRISDGERIRARMIKSKYGYSWAFYDANDCATGEYMNHSQGSKRSAMFKAGYEARGEMAPARAKLMGGGMGVVGMFSCSAGYVRTDNGYPPNAI